jgi:hypothetical protein
MENAMTGDVTSDGEKVWVHSDSGICIARLCRLSLEFLSAESGLDMRGKRTARDGSDWGTFKKYVQERFGIALGDEHEPEFSRNDRQRRTMDERERR